jgi:small GTP-binding protein
MSNPTSTSFRLAPLSYKIILLGDSSKYWINLGVGKSSLIKQFVDHEFNENIKPTCGIDYVTKTLTIDEFTVRLNIFDTAGQ